MLSAEMKVVSDDNTKHLENKPRLLHRQQIVCLSDICRKSLNLYCWFYFEILADTYTS